MSKPVTLCITIGDPGGIGPEVTLKAVNGVRWPRNLRFVVAGSVSFLRKEALRLRLPVLPESADGRSMPGTMAVAWNPAPALRIGRGIGRPSADAARAAAAWITAAVDGCVSGLFDGMATAPISKEGFGMAGIHVPGHTELLARLTGTGRYAMMLVGGPLRVVLVTRHIPLSKVPGKVTVDAIGAAAELAWRSLPWLGVKERKVAICGLNPHAGDGGVLGREELDVIIPAVRRLRRKGMNVIGPLAADTVFNGAMKGRYGVVVAMYHDQGLAPLKTIAFDSGVNITLGLPIVRTSPDHGTAFDIAGKGLASPLSMINAVKLAHRLALRPNPWSRG